MLCAPSSLQHSFPMGDDKFANICVSLQHRVLKNAFFKQDLESFPDSCCADKTSSSYWLRHRGPTSLHVFPRWISFYLPYTFKVPMSKLPV